MIKSTTYFTDDGSLDGPIIEWQTYEYDENGNRIKEIWYNGDGTIRDVREF